MEHISIPLFVCTCTTTAVELYKHSHLFLGLMGIVAYPGQGIYRSVMTTFHTKTKKSIVVATREEMLYLCRDVAANTDNPDVVIQAFQRIRHGTAEEADPLGIRGIV